MTAQATERLWYRGEELSLCAQPLSQYLETIRPDLRLQAPSTALWRGYIGTWKIESDRLYLVGFRGYPADAGDDEELSLADLFPMYPEGVFAHWYTGELRCPSGGLLKYVHGGFGSRHELDLFIKVEKGRVVGERLVRNGQAGEDAQKGYQIAAYFTPGRSKTGGDQ